MSKDKNVYVYLIDEKEITRNGNNCHYAFVGTPEEFYLTFDGDFETVRNLGKAFVYDYGATAEKIEKCRRVMTRMSKKDITEIYHDANIKIDYEYATCDNCGELNITIYKNVRRVGTDIFRLESTRRVSFCNC